MPPTIFGRDKVYSHLVIIIVSPLSLTPCSLFFYRCYRLAGKKDSRAALFRAEAEGEKVSKGQFSLLAQ
jgi:hypothetical protein